MFSLPKWCIPDTLSMEEPYMTNLYIILMSLRNQPKDITSYPRNSKYHCTSFFTTKL